MYFCPKPYLRTLYNIVFLELFVLISCSNPIRISMNTTVFPTKSIAKLTNWKEPKVQSKKFHFPKNPSPNTVSRMGKLVFISETNICKILWTEGTSIIIKRGKRLTRHKVQRSKTFLIFSSVKISLGKLFSAKVWTSILKLDQKSMLVLITTNLRVKK